jgi:tRNA nucleotidyltransferase/poly(A) polymerase
MAEPVIVPRAEHPISRRDIDADALKVLNRLQESGYTAYLVGGSVRDLLLSRRPKDFDIGTSAHPYQIKKLFRNCWIIGRRFRLAHVRFGTKAIEVATFRKNIPAGSESEPSESASARELSGELRRDRPAAAREQSGELRRDRSATAREQSGESRRDRPGGFDAGGDPDLQIKHDNTFGTPEEDAFRRDFTINALFYDIASFSIIDYVGGLQDLKDGLIRSIGDPNHRFQEDPVRMMRAIVMASRLGFRLDEPVLKAIAKHRSLIATSSPARLIEEYYKILRSGAAEQTFRALAEHRLLEPITPEIQRGAKNQALWEGLAALDLYRRGFETAPPTLTNPVLLGTLLIPLGLMPRKEDRRPDDDEDEDEEVAPIEDPAIPMSSRSRFRRPPKEPILKIGALPIARGDTERLRQLLSLQGRIADLEMSPRAKRALMHRGPFESALTWFEIHGQAPAVLEHWKGFIEALGPGGLKPATAAEPGAGGDRRPAGGRRRRRRRGRGFKPRPPET